MYTLYQKYLSPLFHAFLSPITGSPHACRFVPTCSEYARQATCRYGIIQGTIISIYRFLRCNPFSKGGYDPVK